MFVSLRQVLYMSGVQNVKCATRQADRLSGRALVRNPACQCWPVKNLRARSGWQNTTIVAAHENCEPLLRQIWRLLIDLPATRS